MTFCDISKCHNVALLNFVTILGCCHTVLIFFWFFSKNLKCRKHGVWTRNVTTSKIRSLYRALFRRSANIYVSKIRFAVVWLGQIHNLDNGHVNVLGLKSGLERLSVSIHKRRNTPRFQSLLFGKETVKIIFLQIF